MSFIDQILDVGSSIWKGLTGPGVASGIAKATALGYLLKEVTGSINKDNQKPTAAETNKPDAGVRLQVDPDTTNAIPIVYGDAFLSGIVTDARLVNSNQTMWFCLTLSEKTGTLLSTGGDSVISFEEVYWGDQKITFQSDGITAASVIDNDGTVSTDINGLVKVYCFNNGSNYPVVPTGYVNGSLSAAYAVWAGGSFWTSNHAMSNLVFALVRIDYNRDKNITTLPTMTFKLSNTLRQPGDVLYDYMTNTRYGAGIPAAEIYSV